MYPRVILMMELTPSFKKWLSLYSHDSHFLKGKQTNSCYVTNDLQGKDELIY